LFAEHPQCDMINFTGSFRVGRIVGGLAASRIKRVGLELGGKRPAIVYADADLAAAADVVARSIFGGAGQACISGSRLIVERKARDAGLERLVDTASKSKMVPNGSEFSAMAHCIVRWQNVLLSARQDSRTLNRGRDPGIITIDTAEICGGDHAGALAGAAWRFPPICATNWGSSASSTSVSRLSRIPTARSDIAICNGLKRVRMTGCFQATLGRSRHLVRRHLPPSSWVLCGNRWVKIFLKAIAARPAGIPAQPE